MAVNNGYTAQQFIEAIPGSGGIVTTIAKRVGCKWHTAKKYIRKYPTVQRAYDDEREKVLDLAESKVIAAIKKDDIATAKWMLTMKGADRGYVPKEARQIEGDVTLRVVYDNGDD
jgi:hypothetical protein